MEKLYSKLISLTQKYAFQDGLNPTSIPGLFVMKHSKSSKELIKMRWHACLGILLQGEKEVSLEDDLYRFKQGHYTATPVDLPIKSRIAKGSKELPFLGVLIILTPQVLSDISAQMDKLENEANRDNESSSRAMFGGQTTKEMLLATYRLINIIHNPEEAKVIGPLIIKELFYYLLKTENGENIRAFLNHGSKLHKITQAIYKIKTHLSEETSIDALAKEANMSRTSFFQNFKEVTAMGPLQYQKRLRLLEARRLMLEEEETAESSSYKVGYKSPSQFSREYSRMFGNPPLKDIQRNKKKLI